MTYLGLQMLQDENASRHLEVLLIFQQLGRRVEGQNNCGLGSLAAIFLSMVCSAVSPVDDMGD
jgi:hypothetical protein